MHQFAVFRPRRQLPIALALAALLLTGAQTPARGADDGVVTAQHGMVVCVSRPASEVGVAVLRRGGNAVDASVATALALAVTYPEAGNIGGGGFMMLKPGPQAEPICIDYRETAPAASTPDMFLTKAPRRASGGQAGAGTKPAPVEPRLGHRVVGVPGTLRGLELAHEKYGRLEWEDLVAPAVALARDGFEIDAAVAASLNKVLADAPEMAELQRVYGKAGGGTWQAGDRLVQPDLARTLESIARQGPRALYEGPVADQLVAEMRNGGGLITHHDLSQYEARIREPIHGVYRGYDIYAPPPPSSGGIALIEILNILEPFELREMGRASAPTVHLMAEAMRRAYCDRARFLGDPDFVPIPLHLISKQYARQLGKEIDVKHATPSNQLGRDVKLAGESPSTTHFCVVDERGMAVSNTYTLEARYGSRIVVRGAGFLLNNEMSDFNWRPGHTDRSGSIGTEPNQIAPGKRMLSSQTPVVVCRDGELLLLTGSPGGRTIVNTVACLLLNVLEFEMDLQAAVDAPRIHHQWWPDRLQFEGYGRDDYATLVRGLQLLGHSVAAPGGPQGDAHSILVRKGVFHGAADRRISGAAMGY